MLDQETTNTTPWLCCSVSAGCGFKQVFANLLATTSAAPKFLNTNNLIIYLIYILLTATLPEVSSVILIVNSRARWASSYFGFD